MTFRPYQDALVADVQEAWAGGARNVLMRADTGAGKTRMLAHIHGGHDSASCIMAHRQELVGQLSLTLAKVGLHHDLIAAQATRRAIAADHMAELGKSFYRPGARCAVASVDTLVRAAGLERWAQQVTLWTCDEAHHLVEDNKWHRAIGMFTHPQVRGLGPTATPSRADGKGLGRGQGGVFDVMVQGPPMRWLIDQGYLTDYRIVCVESDLARMMGDVGASGDYSQAQLRDGAKRSHIVGDVVGEYVKRAPGKLGITFSTDVQTATEITAAYQAAGVPAATLTGDTDSGVRRQMLRQYARREIMQIVAVDIVSEGFDLPAIEVASLARPTESLALYMQQFGRALRPLEGKRDALIIDHVNNFLKHGPPDRPRPWTLGARDRKSGKSKGGIPLRSCTGTLDHPGCYQPYERIHPACPHCGLAPPEPAGRTAPAQVDGDLAELDAETLAALRGAVGVVDMDANAYRAHLAAKGAPAVGVAAGVNRHAEKQAAQAALRDAMAQWAGPHHAAGETDRMIHRRFFLTWGVDTLSAMALGRQDAEALRKRIVGQV